MLVKKNKKKIMTFGTFDGLHLGHLNLFKQIRELSPDSYLVVSVARDINVKRIKKRLPIHNEKSRIRILKETGLIDKVVLSGLKEYIPHIAKERPDIIALGYDQREYVQDLKKDLKKIDLEVKIIRLKPYKKHIYKNHLLRKKI